VNDAEELVLLLRDAEGGRVELRSPAVGWWTDPPPCGAHLEPGDSAGSLVVLGRARALRLPAGASGVVVSEAPQLRRAPVEYGERLLLLDPDAAQAAPAEKPASSGARTLRAAQSGRLWRHPEPGAAPFVVEGGELEDGRTYALLEVMKTFQPLKYRAGAGLPPRARLLRWLADDGAEVEEGQPLAELGE